MSACRHSTDPDFYVYALFRETGEPFYIGKGRRDRWGDHERQARAGEQNHKAAIIRDMQARGVEVIKVKIHERLPEGVALRYEVAMIAAIGRKPDGPLTNLTYGGDSAPGGIQTQEHIMKRVMKQVGQKRSAEQRARMSAAALGKKVSPEAVAKTANALRGRKQSPEAIANSAAARRGKKQTPEHTANHAAMLRGRKQSAEHIAKRVAKQIGRKMSPEAIAKSAAWRRGTKLSPEAVAQRTATRRANYELGRGRPYGIVTK